MDTQTNDDVLKSDFFSRLSKMIPHKQRDTGKFYPIPRNFRMNVELNKKTSAGTVKSQIFPKFQVLLMFKKRFAFCFTILAHCL